MATLRWDQPQGDGGPESIVDYYEILVISPTGSLVSIEMIFTPIKNITLDYNVNYTVSVVAVNCLGESYPAQKHFMFSKRKIYVVATSLRRLYIEI